MSASLSYEEMVGFILLTVKKIKLRHLLGAGRPGIIGIAVSNARLGFLC